MTRGPMAWACLQKLRANVLLNQAVEITVFSGE